MIAVVGRCCGAGMVRKDLDPAADRESGEVDLA